MPCGNAVTTCHVEYKQGQIDTEWCLIPDAARLDCIPTWHVGTRKISGFSESKEFAFPIFQHESILSILKLSRYLVPTCHVGTQSRRATSSNKQGQIDTEWCLIPDAARLDCIPTWHVGTRKTGN
ncbi:hypothetical protein [Thioflexithrix psekupsensis]|uniref:hypothetical protein n=1 Tax=Thioflexithrix psekupsensis TaxID=1570016 RepID=UPI003CC964DE